MGLQGHLHCQSLKTSHLHGKQRHAGTLGPTVTASGSVGNSLPDPVVVNGFLRLLCVIRELGVGGMGKEGERGGEEKKTSGRGRNPLEKRLQQKGGVIGKREKAHTGTSQSFLEQFPVWLPKSSGIYLLKLDSCTVCCRLSLIALGQRDPCFSSNLCFPHRKLVSPQGTSN